ncbi:hypothetical protein PVK06_015926 [Gossypium arboreum]|uniref:Uncharacterized protein n=1 Tax=Gossypium arboreum TaxID=29729 RepID=A0ABR0PZ05_GOSAR|nr:hypothetical protein PVK06_015926 [Gossypium arboreum]
MLISMWRKCTFIWASDARVVQKKKRKLSAPSSNVVEKGSAHHPRISKVVSYGAQPQLKLGQSSPTLMLVHLMVISNKSKIISKNISKGSQTITDYMQVIKIKADKLATLGKLLNVEDFIEKVLEGLDDTFQPIIDTVNSRYTTIIFDELNEKLINRELALHNSSSSVSVTTYSTHTQRSNQ